MKDLENLYKEQCEMMDFVIKKNREYLAILRKVRDKLGTADSYQSLVNQIEKAIR